MYSVMWSEHCSYKSSRIHLKRLPTEGVRVLVGPGENAGVIDAGDGLAVALRIESHNHPSAIEPYQGAATGVGGILRDIFTMGARPIALMDPLRFGLPSDARSRWITTGVISGISGYGNSVGVPTVGGEIAFDECYADNPLVNVLCCGVLPVERLVLGRASGIGNLALLLGSSTGRDGIGGVSVLASAGFGHDPEAEEAKRPNVQVGDPYEEKRLIEACLQLLDEGLVVGIQDLGGAGLTCATSETRLARRSRDGRRRVGGSSARARHGALGGDDEREPGEDAGYRHPGFTGAGARRLPSVGGPIRGGRACDRGRPSQDPRRLARRGPGRRARPDASRRRPDLQAADVASRGPRRPRGRRSRAVGAPRRRRRRSPEPPRRPLVGVSTVRPPAVLEHRGGPRR